MMMKALLKTRAGEGHLELCDVPVPTPAAHQVLIRVHAVGVCGTDVHILHGTYRTSIPIIIGHEFSGEIVAAGADARRCAPGDRVVVENIVGACGTCALCRTGRSYICVEKKAYGTDSNGAMAEYAVFDDSAIHRIPEPISYEEAALVEPLVVVNHALLERGRIPSESTVVIVGAGTIGLLALQVSKTAGASTVIVAGTSKDRERFAMAKRLGADLTVDVEREDLRDAVRSRTSGSGADVVIEASGSPAGASSTVGVVRRGGQVIGIGLTGTPVSIDWDLAVFNEIDVVFSKSSSYLSWVRALRMIASGHVRTAPLITHRFPLLQWRDALKAVESGEAVKAIVLPAGER